jgi:hypothetical protein
VVGRFVVKPYSGDAYRTSYVDLVDTLRPEDASLILADAACGTDIGGIYLAKPLAGGGQSLAAGHHRCEGWRVAEGLGALTGGGLRSHG